MRAKQAIKNSIERYRSCKSYKDSGFVIQENQAAFPQNSELREYAFKTFFVFPNKFLIEILKEENGDKQETIFWSDGNTMMVYRSQNKGEAFARKLHSYKDLSSHHAIDLRACPILTLPLLIPDLELSTADLFKNNFRVKQSTGEHYHLVSECLPVTNLALFLCKSDFSISKMNLTSSQMLRMEKRIVKLKINSVEFDSQIPNEIFEFNPSTK